ncbi:MAG TPA: cytochrome c3 family protein [Thermoanaerobaculia bacterium]|nr:cytochrome c3 family protein [Thermoanaerobaculia bacterium]
MPRAALMVLAVAAATTAIAGSGKPHPHLDPTVVRAGCPACHAGHGVSRSPMLPASEKQICLRCHDDQAGLSQQVARSVVSADARPPLLGTTLGKASGHPLSADALPGGGDATVVCSSCHASHRSAPGGRGVAGTKRHSPKDERRFEYELCESCHGGGSVTRSRIARLVDPANRSYHPVEAPGSTRSPSVLPSLAGREINCTDCHGNDDPTGPGGPHASNVPPILRDAYRTVDGAAESENAFALCYRCHDRKALMERSTFPLHDSHVVGAKTSCATCHDAHGSVSNRALIRFGDSGTGVSPSVTTGRLAFVSDGSGSGECYINCHGVEHGPKGYGSAPVKTSILQTVSVLPATPPLPREPLRPGDRDRPIGRERPKP